MAFLWDDSVPQQTQKPVYFEDEADVTYVSQLDLVKQLPSIVLVPSLISHPPPFCGKSSRYYPPVPEGVRRGLKPGGENVIRRAIADEAAAQQAEMQKQYVTAPKTPDLAGL